MNIPEQKVNDCNWPKVFILISAMLLVVTTAVIKMNSENQVEPEIEQANPMHSEIKPEYLQDGMVPIPDTDMGTGQLEIKMGMIASDPEGVLIYSTSTEILHVVQGDHTILWIGIDGNIHGDLNNARRVVKRYLDKQDSIYLAQFLKQI